MPHDHSRSACLTTLQLDEVTHQHLKATVTYDTYLYAEPPKAYRHILVLQTGAEPSFTRLGVQALEYDLDDFDIHSRPVVVPLLDALPVSCAGTPSAATWKSLACKGIYKTV